jgi:Zn-dependent metalloprotease
MPIFPRAGKDFNAYYDRQGLKFFCDADKVTGQMIYTCESDDIIAHECGHAVLDVHHPEYWDSLLSETGAFHEAFGDISAVLVALGSPRVRALMLAENGGDLKKSNAVTRLAEQLARGLFDAGYADAVVSANALRDVANPFRYRDPDKLPGRAPATRLSSESHNFSRIFSGAFYDVLIGIYEQLRKENTALSPDAALVQARNDAGYLLAQGLMLAPKGDALFKTIAVAMLAASQQNSGGKYFAVLKKAFVARRLLKGHEANALRETAGAGHTQTSTLAGVASVPLAA